MNSPDVEGGNKKPSVVLQLPVTWPVGRTDETYVRSGQLFQTVHISGRVLVVANDDQRPVCPKLGIRLDHQFGIVFRLQAANVEYVTALDQIEIVLVPGNLWQLRNLCPIRNHG